MGNVSIAKGFLYCTEFYKIIFLIKMDKKMIQKGFLDCFSSEGYDIMESKQDYDIIIVKIGDNQECFFSMAKKKLRT